MKIDPMVSPIKVRQPQIAGHSAERGVVLPVVLVMLVLMTVVVLFMTRRSIVDERLASNVRGVVTLDTAAQYALRWCELALWTAPPGFETTNGFGVDNKIPLPAVTAPDSTATSAWRTDAYWALNGGAVELPADYFTGVNQVSEAKCLVEDASAELGLSAFDNGSEGLRLSDTRRKFRLTAKVKGPVAGADGVTVVAHAQSETRMNLN